MTFLRKITGNGHSHSRSGSASSIKTWSQESATPSTKKLTRLPPKSAGPRKPLPVNYRDSVASGNSYHSSSSDNAAHREKATDAEDPSFGFEDTSSSSTYVQGVPHHIGSESSNSGDSPNTRKSSGGSLNSLSFDKLILSWDPTDPEEWTLQRVSSWFKFHEFPETWISFFKKHQLYGHKFIKLLAYDNFAVYEKFLPVSKNASYTRFQYLLKQTLKKNVTNSHNRQRSLDKSKGSRSSSESLQHGRNKSQDDIQSVRSASESAITITNRPNPAKSEELLVNASAKSHQKTKSAGALYRRSFISLRGSSVSSPGGNQPSNIKLNIPSRPPSITENTVDSTKSISPPISPSYPGLFRRHQKSSSSESSLLNALFGSSNGVAGHEEQLDRSSSNTSTISNENLAKPKNHTFETSSSSPLKQSPIVIEEKNTLWGKLKRRSQIPVSAALPQPLSSASQHIVPPPLSVSVSSPAVTMEPPSTTSDVSAGTLTPVATDPSTTVPTPSRVKEPMTSTSELVNKLPTEHFANDFNASNFLLDKKFYPLKSKDTRNDMYILITKDNKAFIPMNIAMISNLEELKDSITLMLGISHKDITIHLTDFGCQIGSALSDDILESLRSSLFLNTAGKLFIKDQRTPSMRSRAPTLTTDQPLRSVRSKNSVRSVPNSFANSNDEVSIVTSSSDITSFDDLTSGLNRRYPQTPSHYYDTQNNTVNGEEMNYWNLKDQPSETRISPKALKKSNHGSSTSLEVASDFGRKGTFQILRKDDGNEIDFNKRRESPYVQPELAPKREAPKPPTTTSPQRSLSISSQASASHFRSNSSKIHRGRNSKSGYAPIINTQGEAVSPSSETVINSYTPGSSHVLVPQPYKGANDNSRKVKSEEEAQGNPVSAFINKKRSNRSDSIASSNSNFHVQSTLLKRGSSRRIVSSASAADVFEENDITFADAPELSDQESDESAKSSSSDDIIWSKDHHDSSLRNKKSMKREKEKQMDSEETVLNDTDDQVLERKMTLRPSPEVVYQNLEKFFPHANLDKPVLEGTTPPTSPKSADSIPKVLNDPIMKKPNKSKSSSSSNILNNSTENKITANVLKERFPKRAKTIRTIAHEASEARKQSMKVRRQNTKMWGTKTVEVTDKRLVSINKSKNSKGEYREFAWIKGEMIGKGSFGAVFLCLNVTTGEMMAVKQVEVPKYGSQSEVVDQTVEALRSEVSTLKNLDHLNIVQYLGFEVKDNIYSLFLEYVAGGSVGSLIRMYGKFDEVMIKHLTTQVLRGLSYLHSRGILHRDMKADNLLLDQEGVCKISDFGISRKSQDIYSNYDMTMRGTVFWMAPEMVDTTQGYSAKVDIWSLGCVVLEMFAGKRPWSNFEVVAAMFKIGKSKSAPPIPEDTLPLISKTGRDFLDECFKIDPEKRPTADKLLSHPFIESSHPFDFKATKLASLIKSNDKLNSSRLRVSSQESTLNQS